MASKAREALQGVSGVSSVVVDTTGRAMMRLSVDKAPEDAMNEALKKANNAFKVRKLEKKKLPVATQIVNVRIDGFG